MIKRYGYGRFFEDGLEEQSGGDYIEVVDLPVEALENFKGEFRRDKMGWMDIAFTESEYNALRDLLMAISPGVES